MKEKHKNFRRLFARYDKKNKGLIQIEDFENSVYKKLDIAHRPAFKHLIKGLEERGKISLRKLAGKLGEEFKLEEKSSSEEEESD